MAVQETGLTTSEITYFVCYRYGDVRVCQHIIHVVQYKSMYCDCCILS